MHELEGRLQAAAQSVDNALELAVLLDVAADTGAPLVITEKLAAAAIDNAVRKLGEARALLTSRMPEVTP